MRSAYALVLAASVGFALVGCGGSSKNEPPADTKKTAASGETTGQASSPVPDTPCPNPPQNLDSPERAVYTFLDAVRSGDDKKTEGMFTDAARKKIKELNYHVTPPKSDTASFELGAVKPIEEGGAVLGAQVEAIWSDLNDQGARQSEKMLWMVRKEPEGWRIAGAAVVVFPGEPPVLLDFENFEEALMKLQKVQEEMTRRDGGAQPAGPGNGAAERSSTPNPVTSGDIPGDVAERNLPNSAQR